VVLFGVVYIPGNVHQVTVHTKQASSARCIYTKWSRTDIRPETGLALIAALTHYNVMGAIILGVVHMPENVYQVSVYTQQDSLASYVYEVASCIRSSVIYTKWSRAGIRAGTGLALIAALTHYNVMGAIILGVVCIPGHVHQVSVYTQQDSLASYVYEVASYIRSSVVYTKWSRADIRPEIGLALIAALTHYNVMGAIILGVLCIPEHVHQVSVYTQQDSLASYIYEGAS